MTEVVGLGLREIERVSSHRLSGGLGWTVAMGSCVLANHEVESRILDGLNEFLPRPPFTDSETDSLAKRVYGYVWQRSQAGSFLPG